MKKFVIMMVAVLMAAPIFAQNGPRKERKQQCINDECLRSERICDGKPGNGPRKVEGMCRMDLRECRKGERCCMLQDLNLTQEQQNQISKFRLEKRKSAKEFRLEMDVLKAQYRKLVASDNVSDKEVDAMIDKMASLKAQHQKDNYRHMKKVRSVLTEEQKLIFDARRR